MMILKTIKTGPLLNNVILIGCDKTKEAAVIDPAFDSFDRIMEIAKKLKLNIKHILLTHSHWDHIANVWIFKNKLKSLVYVHEDDKKNLENPGNDTLPFVGEIKGVKPDILLKDHDIIEVGDINIEVIHTPGHTVGSVCYYIPEEKIVLTGDTLFKGNVGSCHFSNSAPTKMKKSLRKLFLEVEGDSLIIPGHGVNTKMKHEIKFIDFPDDFFTSK